MWWILAAVAAVVVLGLVAWLMRRPRLESGVEGFKRHIDALSPEARREVYERVQRTARRTRRPEDDDTDEVEDPSSGPGGR